MRSHLAALALALALAFGCGEAPAEPKRLPPLRAWTLVYYMPYDNDLGRHADPILDALHAGIEDESVAIVALVDRPGPGGVERVTLTSGRRDVHRATLEASSHPAVLGRLLESAARKHPARRYALFLLDHGGGLDHIGLDEHPAGGPEWLSARGAARELAEWRRRHGRPLDLLVFQQCSRGTIESHHLLREEAEIIVATQGLLGAPNGYYGAMLRAIARGEAETPDALARAMMEAEPLDGFVELTAVRGPALEALPAELDRALAPLMEASGDDERTRRAAEAALVLVWRDEAYVDLVTFLRALYAARGLDAAPVDALTRFVLERVIVHRRRSPRVPSTAPLGGLSMLIPRGPGVLERYADFPLYRSSELAAFVRRYAQELPTHLPPRLPGQIP